MAGRGRNQVLDDSTALGLDTLEQFATYEDYLDSQVSETDMYYLEDEELARQLVELGYRGSGDTLKRDEFEARKRALRERGTQKANVPKQLASANKDLSQFPFLLALANREELVRNGKLTTIVFLRDRNGKGQEVSGYVDYAHRLKVGRSGQSFGWSRRNPRVRGRSFSGVGLARSSSSLARGRAPPPSSSAGRASRPRADDDARPAHHWSDRWSDLSADNVVGAEGGCGLPPPRRPSSRRVSRA